MSSPVLRSHNVGYDLKMQVFLIDSHRQVLDDVSRKVSFSNLKSFLDTNKVGQ